MYKGWGNKTKWRKITIKYSFIQNTLLIEKTLNEHLVCAKLHFKVMFF